MFDNSGEHEKIKAQEPKLQSFDLQTETRVKISEWWGTHKGKKKLIYYIQINEN